MNKYIKSVLYSIGLTIILSLVGFLFIFICEYFGFFGFIIMVLFVTFLLFFTIILPDKKNNLEK